VSFDPVPDNQEIALILPAGNSKLNRFVMKWQSFEITQASVAQTEFDLAFSVPHDSAKLGPWHYTRRHKEKTDGTAREFYHTWRIGSNAKQGIL
jgi:hypothetical protein